MPFSTAAKSTMLDALTCDLIQLHSGDPGSAGTDNVIAGTLEACTFAAASNGARALNAQVDFSGLTPSQSVTHFSVWEDGSPDVFEGSGAISSGDTAANAAGEFSLTTDTELQINDS